MKFILATVVLSTFLTAHVSAQPKVNELGYPFNAPLEYGNDGDLSWEEVYADDMAKEVMEKIKSKISESKTTAEIISFLNNPIVRDYLIRETKTWEKLSDPVIDSYVNAATILDIKSGTEFKAMFAADPTKALNLISLGRSLLPEEAKVTYLLHPVMENSYLSEDQKLEVLQYVKDNFEIPEQSAEQYIKSMRKSTPD